MVHRTPPSKWSDREHEDFLRGLNTLGKGNWKYISIHYVKTRTPTQVASHAQKYFIRLRKIDPQRARRYDRVEESDENNVVAEPPSPAPVAPSVGIAVDHAMMHAAMMFWESVARTYATSKVLVRTHEIRKPVPLRDCSNVMHALLR